MIAVVVLVTLSAVERGPAVVDEPEAKKPPSFLDGAWHLTQLSIAGMRTSVATIEASLTGVLSSASTA